MKKGYRKRPSWGTINVIRALYIKGELDEADARRMIDPGRTGRYAVNDLLSAWDHERCRLKE